MNGALKWKLIAGFVLVELHPDLIDSIAGLGKGRGMRTAIGLHGRGWGNDGPLLTGRASHPLLEEYPVLKRLVSALRERIVRVELARGEMPTAATPLAFALRYTGGAAVFVRFEAGILVPAIRPPTVPEGTARLRISLSAAHSEDEVLRLAAALREVCLSGVAAQA